VLTISKRNYGKITVLSLTGNLILSTIDSLGNSFREALEEKPEIIALDCRKLSNLDSSGLSLFIRFKKDSSQFKFDLFFCDLNENVTAVFDITKLNSLLTIMSLTEFESRYIKNA